jgi:hypothetical protein
MFCPQCGKEIAETQMFCQHCGAGLAVPDPSSATTGAARPKTPWEDRASTGFFGGLFKTLKEVLFNPSGFFKNMPVTGGLADPLLYALITGMTSLMAFYFWKIVLLDTMQAFMPSGMKGAAEQYVLHGAGAAILAFIMPLLIVVGLFISSGLLHLFLMMVKGSRAGFEATFRVVAYGYSANIFMAVPFCGSLIAGIWTLVLTIIGLKEAHETTGGKAVFAVFLPVIVCCGLFILAMVVIMGAAAVSINTLMHMQK